jgi:hypothetical protein
MANKNGEPSDGAGPEERASGSVEHPIPPDEAQPGDRSELGANLGGPVDIAPGARRRGGVDHATPGAPPVSDRTGPGKQRN